MPPTQTCEQARPEVINNQIRRFLSTRRGRMLTREESREYDHLIAQWLAAEQQNQR